MLMRKNPMIALLLTVVMLFGVVGPVMAVTITDENRSQVVQYVFDKTDELWNNNKMSSDEIYGVYVNMSQISSNTVTATVYQNDTQQMGLTTYTNIKAQPITGVNGAKDKLTRFLHYFGNNNRDVIVVSKGYIPDDTVIGYVYGDRKAEILNAYVTGIPECLEQQRLYDSGGGGGGGSSSTKTTPEINPDTWADKYLTTTFTIDATTYSILNTTGDTAETTNPEIKTMDVKPYIKDNRTYVPVRYLSYSLGVEEDAVTWDSNAHKVGISKDDENINLIIGSPVMYVNGQSVTMDVAPEITHNRTFLPARWVAEALGAEVLWDDATQQTTIKIPVEKPGN